MSDTTITIIAVIILAITIPLIIFMLRLTRILEGIGKPYLKQLSPTKWFILAASSPTKGNQYKCVIDMWATRLSAEKVRKVKMLFEWGWGAFTYDNAKETAEHCINSGHNSKFMEYCNTSPMASGQTALYNKFQLAILEETRQKYPRAGFLGWDLVRALSVVGGAYMGGIMSYEEASRIALDVCRRMQANFSSWDDMIGSYTLGYQFWRGKRNTDRLRYYKKLKRFTALYKIAWDTPLKEDEL